MREIKFRFWNRYQKKFYYADTLESISTIGRLAGNIPLNWMDHQQYTGVKDKNGKDVYEGDVLLIKWDTRPEYTEEVCWMFRTLTWYPAGVLTTGNRDNYYFEVVGNIFETPELMDRPQLRK